MTSTMNQPNTTTTTTTKHITNNNGSNSRSISQWISVEKFQESYTAIFKATIECWIYQLLFIRNVYPKHTFVRTSCGTSAISAIRLGLQEICYRHEHPQVVAYINQALVTIVPSLLSGAATELQFNVITTGTTVDNHKYKKHRNEKQHPPTIRILETFTLRIHNNNNNNTTTTSIRHPVFNNNNLDGTLGGAIPIEVLQDMEQGMRNMILSLHSVLQQQQQPPPPPTSKLPNSHDTTVDNMSFQLLLHVPPTTTATSVVKEVYATPSTTIMSTNPERSLAAATNKQKCHCPELNTAMTTGTWYIPNQEPTSTTILHHTTTSSNKTKYDDNNINNTKYDDYNDSNDWDFTTTPRRVNESTTVDTTDDPQLQPSVTLPANNEKHGRHSNSCSDCNNGNSGRKMTIRPLYLYTDQYFGTTIQCSMMCL